MTDIKVFLAAFFRQLAKDVEALSPEDIEDIVSGKFRFRLVIDEGRRKKAAKQAKAVWDMAALETVAQLLAAAPSREEGLALLQTHCPRKEHLQRLAARLEVAVQARDTIAKLREKIAEAAVGSRLRALAIQG